ncbi:MAG: hypothetical protein HY331_13265 [Chloroflexi bacterium]|nr:hypothetical protein [Chloroflexota bacterium]
MSRAQALYDLQVIDTAIDERSQALAAVEAQLGETEALLAARQAHQETASSVQSLEKRVRDLAWEVQDFEAKIKPLDEKLYSGRVRNPKELNDLHREIEGLKVHKRQLEDAELDLMVQLEDVQQARQAAAGELARVEADWRAEQERLTAEREALLRETAQLQARREQALLRVFPADLHQYEHLRPRKGGRAVARVERSLCGACRIALSSSEFQRVRSASTPMTCTSCGRILYAG